MTRIRQIQNPKSEISNAMIIFKFWKLDDK